MRKADYTKANHIYKDTLSHFYIDSAGKSKGVQYNHIGVMAVNNTIDFYVKKNNFRLTCKNNNAIMNLGDKNYFFFFVLEGNCKVKITYPYYK